MRKLPFKITIRLDRTAHDRLEKFMARKGKSEYSMIVRKALRAFLEQEEAAHLAECERVDGHIKPIVNNAKPINGKAVKS